MEIIYCKIVKSNSHWGTNTGAYNCRVVQEDIVILTNYATGKNNFSVSEFSTLGLGHSQCSINMCWLNKETVKIPHKGKNTS